jgi:3-oxoadipate enol-lactonase
MERAIELSVAGAVLHVEVDGPDDVATMLTWNGAGCSSRMWDAVLPKLTDRYRVVRFDVRGTGRSTPTEDAEKQYTFEQYTEDAIRILDELGVAQCHLWSMAWGSRAALAFAAWKPERVLRAAFFDASIGAADVAAQKSGHEKALELQAAAGVAPFERPQGWNHHEHPDSVRSALAAAARVDLSALVPSLSMPVLVATGDCDPNLASSRELALRAPNAHLVVMKNVGHGSVLQRPDLTSDLVIEFLGDAS